ncbi:MAG: Heterodisulfide reductase, subunit A, selenocysteine-containing [Desulfotomaculum sp. 46_296]|nr:MAG: Heterodisulfide reductase, subunit A, selenocysteine-containing [Desulfotomaculum sp. 46_296]
MDVPAVAREAAKFHGVVYSAEYKYMCSEPGQEMIVSAIKEHRLTGVVVASCSPALHEITFRKNIARAGLNPYMLEMANIREQCSWVHQHEPEKATKKAIDLVRRAVAKAGKLEPLFESTISACISTPKMVSAAQHPNIKIYTYAEVEEVKGYIGNFSVVVKQKARSVNSKCTGCGTCWAKCPTKNIPNEFDLGMSMRKAIYIPFPQAVPNRPVIDRERCRQFVKGKCGVCKKFCPTDAIDYEQGDEFVTENVGAILVATGYDLIDWAKIYGEYGYGKYPDVITGLHFERMVNASGPTGGKIVRPSDGEQPKTVVFVKCVGSRDEAKAREYCSRACCMYTAKHAHQVLEKIPGSQVVIFYIDVRCAGKAYEEFYLKTLHEGAIYTRGRVSKIYPEGNRLIVKGADTLLGRPVEVVADMVVLATAMIPAEGSADVARTVGFTVDKDGFFQEAHPKLRPVETNTGGVFLAGACQGPKDIPDTVAQASGAAAKIIGLLSHSEIAGEPTIARVNEAMCSGCLACREICPYRAIEPKEIVERLPGKQVTRVVASVNSGLCQGCGACTVACRPGALNLKGFTNEQLLSEVDALCL